MNVLERVTETVDAAAIEEAAISVAHQLETFGYAEYLLSPGDATCYPFVVLPAGRTTAEDGGVTTRRNYLVILAAGFGTSYEWSGHPMHWDYCAEKWAKDHREWTGCIVAMFLTALSAHVQAVP